MSDAQIALGAYLEIDVSQSGSWIEFAEVKSIAGPSRDKQLHDVTHLRSPNRYREWKSGLKDGGELTLTVNFIPGDASVTAAFDAFESESPQNYRLFYPEGEVSTFTGELFNITDEKAFDGILSATIQIKVTGVITEPT